MTDLYLQDSYFQFSELTEQQRRIFSNVYQLNRPYEFVDNVHIQVSFEFDLTLYRVDRDVYSTLDWVGDVGGLYEGFYLFLYVILIASQFNEFEHLLIERLFTKPVKELDDASSSRVVSDEKTIWIRQRLIDAGCFRSCLKLSKEERYFARARH